jgi:hypothetical protein
MAALSLIKREFPLRRSSMSPTTTFTLTAPSLVVETTFDKIVILRKTDQFGETYVLDAWLNHRFNDSICTFLHSSYYY